MNGKRKYQGDEGVATRRRTYILPTAWLMKSSAMHGSTSSSNWFEPVTGRRFMEPEAVNYAETCNTLYKTCLRFTPMWPDSIPIALASVDWYWSAAGLMENAVINVSSNCPPPTTSTKRFHIGTALTTRFMIRLLSAFIVGLLASSSPLSADGTIVWGSQKEGVKVGVQRAEWDPKHQLVLIHVARATNYANNLVMPEDFQKFEIRLRDSTGSLVELTREGKKYGATVNRTMRRPRKVSRQIRFHSEEVQQIANFRLTECFKLEVSGNYELEICVRLLKETDKGLQTVAFDPIKIRLYVTP